MRKNYFRVFAKFSKYVIKMKTQKIINLLSISENEYPIKFLTSSLESSLCNYSDACVLVTGNIAVTGADDNTKAAFKNFAPFRKCRTEINKLLLMKQNILILQCLCTI